MREICFVSADGSTVSWQADADLSVVGGQLVNGSGVISTDADFVYSSMSAIAQSSAGPKVFLQPYSEFFGARGIFISKGTRLYLAPAAGNTVLALYVDP